MAFLTDYPPEPFDQSIEIMNILTAPSGSNGFGLTQMEANKHEALGGCCLSICFQWIKLKISNSKESAANRITKVKNSIAKAINRQNLQDELWSIGGSETNYSVPAKFIGVKLNTSDLTKLFIKIDLVGKAKIKKRLQSMKKVGMLMDYRWTDNAGHAVAWYVSSGKVVNINQHIYFFDPNLGEFKVLLKNVQTFIIAYFNYVNVLFLPPPQLDSFNMIGVKDDTSLKNVWERKGMIKSK